MTLHLWNLRRASGVQANTRVFWDRRKANTSNPRQEYGTTLEALSDKVVVVTLNNWTVQSDRSTTIKVLEKHINPYLEWDWDTKEQYKLDAYEKYIIQWHNMHLPNTFKLLLSHIDLAHSVCCSINDKNVQQADGTARVNCRS